MKIAVGVLFFIAVALAPQSASEWTAEGTRGYGLICKTQEQVEEFVGLSGGRLDDPEQIDDIVEIMRDMYEASGPVCITGTFLYDRYVQDGRSITLNGKSFRIAHIIVGGSTRYAVFGMPPDTDLKS